MGFSCKEVDNSTDLHKRLDDWDPSRKNCCLFFIDAPLMDQKVKSWVRKTSGDPVDLQKFITILNLVPGNHTQEKQEDLRSISTPFKRRDILEIISQCFSNHKRLENIEPDGETDNEKDKGVCWDGSYRLLLAEDDMINQVVACELIETMKLGKVDIAQNGKKAVEMARSRQYDIILMDGQMPIMNGLDATREIRRHEIDNDLPRIPIIALTAHAMKQNKQRFFDAGIDDYITKPLKRRDLHSAFQTFFNGKMQTDDQYTCSSQNIQMAVDRAELEEIMNGNTSLLNTCYKTFISTYPNLLNEIRASIEKKKQTNIKKKVHRLKGMLKYLAAGTAVGLAQRIEKERERGTFKDALKVLTELEEECGKVDSYLASVIGVR